MVICIIALLIFSILGIGSLKYRRLAKEALTCVMRTIVFKPCETKLDQRIKSKLTAKLMKRTPALARFIYKNFKVLSWVFTITFFASLSYSAYGISNLIIYGRCEPGSPVCEIGQVVYIISCYEREIVYGVIVALFIAFLYFVYKYLKFKE